MEKLTIWTTWGQSDYKKQQMNRALAIEMTLSSAGHITKRPGEEHK